MATTEWDNKYNCWLHWCNMSATQICSIYHCRWSTVTDTNANKEIIAACLHFIESEMIMEVFLSVLNCKEYRSTDCWGHHSMPSSKQHRYISKGHSYAMARLEFYEFGVRQSLILYMQKVTLGSGFWHKCQCLKKFCMFWNLHSTS